MPTLQAAFEEYLEANPSRAPRDREDLSAELRAYLSDWVNRSLDGITRKNVEARFNRLTEKRGWSTANQTMSMLRSIYRRPCVDHEGLKNPVELWLAGGGKFPPQAKADGSPHPAKCCRAGGGASRPVRMPAVARDVLWVGVYTGMRLGEITSLRWERVDLKRRILRVDETKTGEVLGVADHAAVGRNLRAPVRRLHGRGKYAFRMGISIADEQVRALARRATLPCRDRSAAGTKFCSTG